MLVDPVAETDVDGDSLGEVLEEAERDAVPVGECAGDKVSDDVRVGELLAALVELPLRDRVAVNVGVRDGDGVPVRLRVKPWEPVSVGEGVRDAIGSVDRDTVPEGLTFCEFVCDGMGLGLGLAVCGWLVEMDALVVELPERPCEPEGVGEGSGVEVDDRLFVDVCVQDRLPVSEVLPP